MLAFLATTAQGQLILNIDPNRTEIFFTGSDSGQTDPASGSGDGIVFWTLGIVAGPAQEIRPIAPRFDIDSGPGTLRTAFSSLDVVDGTFSQTLNLILHFSDAGTYSLSGNSSTISYSSLSVDNQAYLESLDGRSLTLLTGTDWSSVDINVIPEPASALLLGLGAAAVLLGRRKRRR